MKKKGQFTLFVILGVVLVALVRMFYVYRAEIFSLAGFEELALPSEVNEISDDVASCVDASAYEAVSSIGLYGGYYVLPGSSYTDSNTGVNIPYYLYDGNNLMVSKSFIEAQIGVYIEYLLISCLNLEQFAEYTISTGAIDVISIINNNSVDIVVNYPITVVAGENSYNLNEDYSTSVNANLGWVYDIARSIINAHLDTPDEFSYTLLESFELSSIVVTPIEDGSLIYVLTDRTSFNGEQPLIYMFAEHYVLGDAVECVEDLDCDEDYTCTNSVCKEVKE